MGANKYSVETQIDFFSKKVSGKPLEDSHMDLLSGEMTPGDIHDVTERDIQWVRDFIANERKNYPNTSLEPLFQEWERLQKQYEEKLGKGKAAVTAEATRKVEEAKRKQQEEEASARKPNSGDVNEKKSPETVKWSGFSQDDDGNVFKDGKFFTGNIDKEHPFALSSSNIYYGGMKEGKFDGTWKCVSKDGKTVWEGVFKNGSIIEGTITEEKEGKIMVTKGKWNDKKEFTGTITVKKEGKEEVTVWKDGKEVKDEGSETKVATKPEGKASWSAESPAMDKQLKNNPLLWEVPTAIIFRDGNYYMIGKHGEKKRIEYSKFSGVENKKELSPEQKSRLPLLSDIAIFLEAFTAEYPKRATDAMKMWGKALDYMNNGGDSQQMTGEIVVGTIGTTFVNSDWLTVFAIKEPQTRRLELYKLIKWMGQYDLVATYIANDYMKKWTPEQVKKAIADLSQSGQTDMPGVTKESQKKIANEVKDMKNTYQKAWSKNEAAYSDAYKKEYKITTNLTPEQLKTAEQIFIERGLDQAFRMAALRERLRSSVDWKGKHENPTLDLASSILGTGTINISSRMTRDVSATIAIEAIAMAAGAVTMGIGTYAINALSVGRLARIATLGTEAGSLGRFTVSSIGQGTAFELGHGAARGKMTGEQMYSVRGFGDAILFTGVLNGVGKLLAEGGTLTKLGNWTRTGSGMVKFTKGTFIDGAALNVVGITSRIVFDKDVAWSPEEIAQAFIMAGLFRWTNAALGKFKAGRDTNGEMRVEPVVENVASTPTIVAERVVTIREYARNQRLSIKEVKTRFINEAQPGDIVLLRDMGTLEKLADGRWKLTNGGDVRYFETNGALIADPIAGWGNGRKDFIVERLAGEPTAPITPPTTTPSAAEPTPATPREPTAPAEPTPEKLSEGKFLKAAGDIWKQAKKSTDSIVVGEYSVKWNTQTKKLDVTLPENGGVRSFDTQGKFALFLKEGNKSKGIIDTIKAQKGNPAREVRIGETGYAINKEGKFIKKETIWDRELTSEEISWLIDRNPDAVLDAVTNTKAFWKGFDDTITYFKDTPGKFMWDVATKEVNTDSGLIKPVVGTLANFARYPLVTTRTVVDTLRGESTSKTKDILKAVFLWNKNVFQEGTLDKHKMQALTTIGLVIYVGARAVNDLHSNHPDAKGISSWTIVFLEYVKNLQLSPMIDTLVLFQIDAVKKASEAVEKW